MAVVGPRLTSARAVRASSPGAPRRARARHEPRRRCVRVDPLHRSSAGGASASFAGSAPGSCSPLDAAGAPLSSSCVGFAGSGAPASMVARVRASRVPRACPILSSIAQRRARSTTTDPCPRLLDRRGRRKGCHHLRANAHREDRLALPPRRRCVETATRQSCSARPRRETFDRSEKFTPSTGAARRHQPVRRSFVRSSASDSQSGRTNGGAAYERAERGGTSGTSGTTTRPRRVSDGGPAGSRRRAADRSRR